MKTITYIILAFLIFSCSGSYHLRKAYKKSPELFADSVTTRVIEKKPISGDWGVDFDNLLKGDRIVLLNTSGTDTVKVTLTKTDTAYVEVEVDCPPVEVVTKTKTVYIPEASTWKDFMSRYWYFLLGFFVIGIFVAGVSRSR